MPSERAAWPPSALLGGLGAHAFLRRHWQKQPLLVRQALEGGDRLFDRRTLLSLACRDDVESRVVVREGRRWSMTHGPFRLRDFTALGTRGWTLLVQGVNLFSDDADALLRRFAFLPYARLDDLMVSYAVDGGGVGPHFDSYDVFLLQASGRRRWRYGRQRDLSLRPGLPVRILRRFSATDDVVLGPGDMLYLPPQWAHDGIALGECTTCSIGFRADSAQELATAFLDFLRDRLALDGRYADPDLAATQAPAQIDRRMRRRVATMLAAVRWDAELVDEFLGTRLSEPKPHVFFEPPSEPLTRSAFRRGIARGGVVLDRRTQMLYDERRLYVNGSAWSLRSLDARAVRELADRRALGATSMAALAAPTIDLLYDGYRNGYLAPGS
jgi:50S ribosomal protein L16 3-hydroxylase